MRTLAIDSATENCSAALFEDGVVLGASVEKIGRGHAEKLIPMVADLPGKGQADRIVVSLGPGSFTGLRIGLAAARALGMAWGTEVLGYPTLALVAAMAQDQSRGAVTVCMTGGHGEWFVQDFAANSTPSSELSSLPPAEAARSAGNAMVAGSQATALVEMRGSGQAVSILPDARFVNLLPQGVFMHSLAPLYGRAPDARLPVAR